MADTPTPEKIDYEAKAEVRHDNFVARATAAITGVVAGVTAFKHLQQNALNRYVKSRLNTRDWINGALDESGRPVEGADIAGRLNEILDNIRTGKAQTISGAPTFQTSLDTYEAQRASGEFKQFPGTTVGDVHVNAAYRELLNEKKPFVDSLVDDYRTKANKLMGVYKEKLAKLEKTFLKDHGEQAWAEVATIEKQFQLTGNMNERIEAIRKLGKDKPHLFGGRAEKFFEEVTKERENLKRYTDDAKEALVDKPIFEELIERMGLRLRQVPRGEHVKTFAAVAGVAMGAVAYMAVRGYQKRNDKADEEERSFQAMIDAKRDAAAKAAAENARSA